MNTATKQFGNRLKQILKARKLNVDYLADVLRLDRSNAYIRISGKKSMTVDEVQTIAKALNVQVEIGSDIIAVTEIKEG